MAFDFAAGGGPGDDWYLAKSLVTLAGEMAIAHPEVTCLGTLGDDSHQAEGYSSDHNPFIIAPNGKGVVRAIDIGGPDATLKVVRQHIWILYATKFPPLYEFGYAKGTSDNLINGWGLPFTTHVDTGDAGHLHVSVTQVDGNNPSPAGYLSAIDSTAPWGFLAPTVAPAAPTQEDDDMEFIRNKDTGAVVAHLGGGVLESVTPATYTTWNNLRKPVTQLATGPWTDYVNFIGRGAAASAQVIAAAVNLAATKPDPTT